jgi:hypothetical protein
VLTMRRRGFEPLIASFLRHLRVRVVVVGFMGLLLVVKPRGVCVRSMGKGLLSVRVGT